MTFANIREKLAKQFLMPWESIDPREEENSARAQHSSSRWFLESPPGRWEIEPAPHVSAKSSATDESDRSGEVEKEEEFSHSAESRWGVWTLTMLCIGLAIISACILVPEADASRRMVYDRDKLQLDLNQIREQVQVNSQFLGKLESDPQLTQRLAEREMRSVPAGQTVVDPKPDAGASTVEASAQRMSPFMIVNVPPPPPLAPYQPVGGAVAEICRDSRTQTLLLGAGMLLVAGGLVFGDSGGEKDGKSPAAA